MNVEQIIIQSTLTGTIPNRLKEVPLDDLGIMLERLAGMVSLIFFEKKVGGIWLTAAIGGYIGKEENSPDNRIVWHREFPEPLPHSVGYRYGSKHDKTFGIIADGIEYTLHKVDGSYLGSAKVEEKYRV